MYQLYTFSQKQNHSWEANIRSLNSQTALPARVNLTIAINCDTFLYGTIFTDILDSDGVGNLTNIFYLKMSIRDSRGNMLGCQFLQLWLQDLESAFVSQLWRRIPGLNHTQNLHMEQFKFTAGWRHFFKNWSTWKLTLLARSNRASRNQVCDLNVRLQGLEDCFQFPQNKCIHNAKHYFVLPTKRRYKSITISPIAQQTRVI